MVALMACRLSFWPPERVVGEIDRVHFQRRVAVHELVELLRAQREGGQHLAVVVVLLAVGDHASLDQRHDAVADHFGVDAEVVLVGQLHDHGVGNAAVADLQRGAIGNHVGDVLADRLLDRADLRQADFEDGLSLSHRAATCEMWMWQSPLAKGTFGLTSSTTTRAFSMAAMV
jgi:hypothetical protein